MIEQLKRRTPIARKAHKCNYCHSFSIQPGHAYIRCTNVYDGRVYDWISCCACDMLVEEVWAYGGDGEEGLDSSMFYDWAESHYKHGYPGAYEFLVRYYGDDSFAQD